MEAAIECRDHERLVSFGEEGDEVRGNERHVAGHDDCRPLNSQRRDDPGERVARLLGLLQNHHLIPWLLSDSERPKGTTGFGLLGADDGI
jgi:hypothetical protein